MEQIPGLQELSSQAGGLIKFQGDEVVMGLAAVVLTFGP